MIVFSEYRKRKGQRFHIVLMSYVEINVVQKGIALLFVVQKLQFVGK
jgi:hypothetical protein